jgi:HAD superfamily hydrolase (TIGR01509 family)
MNKPDFAIIFDMDGVLIDSVRLHWQAMNQALAKYNIHIDDDQLRNYIGQSVINQLNQISEKFATPLDSTAIIAEIDPIKAELQRGIQPKEGVVDLLNLLRTNGVAIAVGTSSSRAATQQKLTDAGILDFFQALVTEDDVTAHKPDPMVYLTAAEALGFVPEKCIVFEDAPSGIIAAKRAGMRCIAVQTAYTLPEDLRDADASVVSLADVTIETLESL